MLLPAVSGLAGTFLSEGAAVLRASIVIDYQNVHLTAHDVFDPRGENHRSLIHPVQFAKIAIKERNDRQRTGHPAAELARVAAYRGLPHVDHNPEQHRRCLEQASQWRRDGATVELRDLKYRFQLGANGRPIVDVHGKKTPIGRPKENGIDVLCALACIREASRADVDVVILASRDTDLVPALDEVYDLHGAEPERYGRIETVSRFNNRPPTTARCPAGACARQARAASGTPTSTVPATRRPSTATNTAERPHRGGGDFLRPHPVPTMISRIAPWSPRRGE